jgi:hypothetical protein
MRRRGLLLSALAGGACAQGPGGPLAVPLSLPTLPGPIRPLGALHINTQALGFGGLSALHLDEGLVLTAISDTGRWFRAQLLLRGETPAGLGPATTGILRDGSGETLSRGRPTDAEALARLPDGTWLVGFERWHRIRAFRSLDAPGAYFEAPPGLASAPSNGGLEALASLADGRLLAIAEFLNDPADASLRQGWIGGPGAWRPIRYRPAPGFAVTDAAGLPDGGALVLERRFALLEGGFSARLVRVSAAALRGPDPITGDTLLNLPPDGPAENWEGVTILRRGTALWIGLISDDNENAIQRSLFLLYAWAG